MYWLLYPVHLPHPSLQRRQNASVSEEEKMSEEESDSGESSEEDDEEEDLSADPSTSQPPGSGKTWDSELIGY